MIHQEISIQHGKILSCTINTIHNKHQHTKAQVDPNQQNKYTEAVHPYI